MIMVLAVASLMAQAPEKFSYQAVVRNASNALVTNAPVSVRVSVLQGGADGEVLYVETHSAVTNANGLLTVEIGGGKVEQGAFGRIDWASGPFFLKTETDPNGGENYSITSVQQLLSVPYALYAREAANSFSGDYNDLKNKPAIPQNVGELTNDAGYITLSDIPAAPKGGEANDAGVVQTTACGEIDLCEMANQLAQQQMMLAALLPTVTTGTVGNLTETEASCGGTITDQGYRAVTARGVCWSTNPNPTVEGSHTSDGSGTGTFSSSLSGLTAGTTYFVRAYATNSVGTAYGEEVSFTTEEEQPQDTCPTITLPYSENFDSYTTSTTAATGVQPTCWQLMQSDVAMTNANRPQLYYKSSYAHSGSYSLLLNYRGVYAMPALSENVQVNQVTLEMYLRQPKSYYALEVGVWEDNGTFVPVTLINNSTTNVEFVEVDFSNYSGNGRRIAFRNVLGGGANYNYSYNYIDDIKLYVIINGAVVDEKSCPGASTVTDIDGNTYSTVQIGNQCWMREHLRTTHYANGAEIPLGTYPSNNVAFRYYPNSNPANVSEYGYVYNWSAVMNGESGSNTNPSNVQGICPDGWHVPSKTEWEQLFIYVGSQSEYVCNGNSNNIAKALASTTGWHNDGGACAVGNNPSLNNATGFNAMPADQYDGNWVDFGSTVYFWSATDSSNYLWGISLNYTRAYVSGGYGDGVNDNYHGFSVRCLRDSTSNGGGTSATLPTVTSRTVSEITATTATCGGEVTADGGAEVTNRGVCWSTEPNPAVEDDHTSDGAGTGTFNSSITGLIAGTTYHVRAYATNSVGTAYGEEVSFTTEVEQPQDTCPTITLPYSENFDSYTTSTTASTGVEPTCWELVQEDVAMTDAYKPQLYYKSSFAHSGNYSLKMGYRGVYAMPALTEGVAMNLVKLEMYLRQANAAYQLEVGVWDDATQTFEAVQLINNSTTNVESVEVDFSSYAGNGRRIAFHNVLGGGANYKYSYNYLDDITLSVIGGVVVDEKSCPGAPTVTDIDGNTYSTVQIGQQCWMRENMRTTHYADGSDIPYWSDNILSPTEPYYYYNSNWIVPGEVDYYYNWSAAMHDTASNTTNPNNVQGICPNGWHLPSDAEWTQLLDYVSSEYSCGGGYNAKALASTQGWDMFWCGLYDDHYNFLERSCRVCDTITNNASGFGARPVNAWYLDYYDGWSLGFVGTGADFCSSSNRVISIGHALVEWYRDPASGVSVRCLSDASSGVGGSTAALPTVVTSSVSNITVATATCGGEVTSNGGVYVTGRGMCWSTEPNPTVDDSHTSVGQGSGAFTSSITGLISGTTYYVRAYATNCAGTAYGEEVSFTTTVVVGIPAGDAQPCPAAATVTDYDGNVYNTIKIGEQCWMKENLRTIHFPDGMPISTSGGSDSSPCLYNYSSSGVDLVLRGYLYNWTAVMYGAASSSTNPSNVQGICPDGWHVPSDAEWTQLTDYVNSISAYRCGDVSGNIAKALAVTEGWNSSTADGAIGYNPSGNNATGFSAVSAGYWNEFSGFSGAGCDAYYWSSSFLFWDGVPYSRQLNYNCTGVIRAEYVDEGIFGYSVRCLRDSTSNGGGTSATLPTVITGTVSEITATTATCGGEVTDDGGATVTARGVCWSTSPNPTVGDSHTTDGSGIGSFTSSITGLTVGTSYYVRAYATNSEGTAYGTEVNFTTLTADSGAVIDEKSCPGTPTVTDHEGNVYATVQIGNQCWMRDNLRTATSPSTGTYLVPAAGTGCTYTGKQAFWYNNDSATYAPMNYGLLYNWNAAMDTFNTSYGETSVDSSSSNAVSVSFPCNRRGICPTGWHLPSDEEWTALKDYVSSQPEYTCGGDSYNIAKALASTEGWVECVSDDDWYCGDCAIGVNSSTNNATGFSAIPAGRCGGSLFNNAGAVAEFWSSTQKSSSYAFSSCSLYNDYASEEGGWSYYKYDGFSVRCLRDTTTVVGIPAGDAQPCPGIPTVTDYDGNTYNTVQIGNQCWMRENLRTTHYADGTAIPAGGSNTSSTAPYYYDYSTHSLPLEVRGYLYNWPAAMHGASSSSANPSGVQGICPAGWHLPSDVEWAQLEDYVGSQPLYTCGGFSGARAKALASETGWNSSTSTCAVGNDPTSNNASGFSVVPAGCWYGGFDYAGTYAYFWSSTKYGGGAWPRYLYYTDAGVYRDPYYRTAGFSVRCLRD